MQTVSVPWAMWYSDKFDLTFPDTWDLTVSHMKGGADIGDAGIRQAFAEPIGAPPLREVAKGRRDAAILIDDLTRPTPSYRVLPYILEELAAGGIPEDKVTIVCAIAAHRSLTRDDFIKKIGLELVEKMHVVNHNAQDNLEYYGQSSQGIPIWVNREFARADVKIAAGMITPRGSMFGGGAKLLLPGACGRQTIYLNHSYCPGNIFRQHIAEVARMVGLEYIVNPLLNEESEIMAMVTGDIEEAYWHGVEIGKRMYHSPVTEENDVVICNAWPKDTEGTQSAMAQVPLFATKRKVLREDGTVVIATSSPEGLGFHSVMMPGTLFRIRSSTVGTGGDETMPPFRQVIFSPGMNKYDVESIYGKAAIFCKTWPQVLEVLERVHGTSPKALVFPCGAMQYSGELPD